MAAFRRFDPYAALADGEDRGQATLATLASLAEAPPATEKRAGAQAFDAQEHRKRGSTPAKVAKPANPSDPAIWGEGEEERAAIVEHEGNIPRAWAAGFARLHPDHPPSDVPLRRWQRFVDDVGIFLDRWAAYAAALGWGPHDLFGSDRNRPFARIDQSGLLWLLNGDKLIALTENTATIERRTGARQTYRRKPSGPGQVLAWELARDG